MSQILHLYFEGQVWHFMALAMLHMLNNSVTKYLF